VRLGPAVALAVCLAATLAWGSAAAPAQAQNPAAPATCRVGAYLVALTAFEPEADTFDADLWLWSVCPDGARRPLETMEFVNAQAVEARLASDVARGGAIWSQRKVRGTFRHDWDERAYPFDRHVLSIVLEEGVEDAAHFRYESDAADTAYDLGLSLPGWTITGFDLTPSLAHYRTTFGDPALPAGAGSDYSRLTLVVGLARADRAGFFKLTAVVYAAFALSLVTYVMHLESTRSISPQMGLLAAALFAAAVNLVTAGATLGNAQGLTLVDEIHIVVLLYIVAAGAVTVWLRLLVERGWPEVRIARLSHQAGAVAVISFLAINVALIAVAVDYANEHARQEFARYGVAGVLAPDAQDR
jgi:hypothetical protein